VWILQHFVYSCIFALCFFCMLKQCKQMFLEQAQAGALEIHREHTRSMADELDNHCEAPDSEVPESETPESEAPESEAPVPPMYRDEHHVLMIDADKHLTEQTRDYLEANGFHVSIEPEGANGVERILALKPDLVMLDLMLPGEDGLSVCRRVRPDYAGQIMMMSARTDDMDQVLGLEMGADDYVFKPVQPRVLLARIRALLRRVRQSQPGNEGPLRFANLEIDNTTRRQLVLVTFDDCSQHYPKQHS